MALCTPDYEFLASIPLSEFRNYSKYDWLFAVFQLYVASCDWQTLHFLPDNCSLEPVAQVIRQQTVLDEKYPGLLKNGKKIAAFRAWNQLADIPTQGFRVGDATMQSLDDGILSPESASAFNDYMALLPRAKESHSYASVDTPPPITEWITQGVQEIEHQLKLPDSQESLASVFSLPSWDWPMDSPLDLWPNGQFSLDCYYYATLFANWLQEEPAFFQILGKVNTMAQDAKIVQDLIKDDVNFQCRRSICTLSKLKHTLDVQQAFLELWWRDNELRQKRLFSLFETVEAQSKQFFTVVGSIQSQIYVALDRPLTADQQAQFNDAVNVIKFEFQRNLDSDSLRLDLAPEDRNKANGLKAIMPRLSLDRSVLEKLVALFLLKDFFYYDLLPPPIPANIETKALSSLTQDSHQKALSVTRKYLDELATANEWAFEAWKLFVCYFEFTDAENGLGTGRAWPLFNAWIADEAIKQEREACVTRNPLRSPTLLLWDTNASNNEAINEWVEDALVRLSKAIEHNIQVTMEEIAQPTVQGRSWPIIGHYGRWRLYAALFNRLLNDPPTWLSQLQPKQAIKPAKHYAAKPFRELLEGGYYKVMLALYELTHGRIPNFQSDEEERTFIDEEVAKIHLKEGAITYIQWARSADYSHLLEGAEEWAIKARERLTTFSELESSATKSLEKIVLDVTPPLESLYLLVLWINIVQHPLKWLSQNANRQATEEGGKSEVTNTLPLVSVGSEFARKVVLVNGQRLYKVESKKQDFFVGLIEQFKTRKTYELPKPSTSKSKKETKDYVDDINVDYRRNLRKQGQLLKTTRRSIIRLFEVENNS